MDIGFTSEIQEMIFWSVFFILAILLYFAIPYGIVLLVARRLGWSKKRAHLIAGLVGFLVFGFTKLFP